MANPIACMLKKIKAGLVPEDEATKIIDLTNKYVKDLDNLNVNDAAKLAIKKTQDDLISLSKQADEAQKAQTAATTAMKATKNAKTELRYQSLEKYQPIEVAALNRIGQPLGTFTTKYLQGKKWWLGASQLENEAIASAIFGDKPATTEFVSEAAKAITESLKRGQTELERVGATGSKTPITRLAINFSKLKLEDFTPEKFADDVLTKIDKEHLANFLPLKTSPEDFLKLGHKALTEGLSFIGPEIQAAGFKQPDFLHLFNRAIKPSSGENFIGLSKDYGIGSSTNVDVLGHAAQQLKSIGTTVARYEFHGNAPTAYTNHLINLIPDNISLRTKALIIKDIQTSMRYIQGGYNSLANSNAFEIRLPGAENYISPVRMLSSIKAWGAVVLQGKATGLALLGEPAYSRAHNASLYGDALGEGRAATAYKINDSVVGAFQSSRTECARLGYTITSELMNLTKEIQATDTTMASPLSKKIGSFSLKTSGLTALTTLSKDAGSINDALNITEHSETPFEQLRPRLQQDLSRFGVTPEDWKALGEVPRTQLGNGGLKVISLEDMLQNEDTAPLARKIGQFMSQNEEFRTPLNSIRFQKWIQQLKSTNAAAAVLAESMGTFTGHVASVTNNWIRGSRGWQPYTRLVAYGTSACTVASILFDISNGIKPNFDSEKYMKEKVLDGFIMSGAGAFYSSLFLGNGSINDTEQKIGAKVAGFGLGTLTKTVATFIDEGQKALEGKPTDLSSKLFDEASTFIPGRQHWALKYFFDREVIDNVHKLLNPNYNKVLLAREKNLKTHLDTTYYSPPSQS